MSTIACNIRSSDIYACTVNATSEYRCDTVLTPSMWLDGAELMMQIIEDRQCCISSREIFVCAPVLYDPAARVVYRLLLDLLE